MMSVLCDLEQALIKKGSGIIAAPIPQQSLNYCGSVVKNVSS
jgi:hypothetical protein